MWVGTKSMTPIRFATGQAEKITEGLAQGKGKKDRGSFNKCLKNQIISFIKTAGFFALVQGWVWTINAGYLFL